ncbi:hypothetical protein L2E82_32206 [Cichorium intybus]|uniref:Uncharacterized protein n=1 Tax=Cichorium intybus TaxID=13427 RepID=A0ACB9BGW0_CICIN|nr:hypothetical protein L2E82_32206 [Cichorium intybus]
MSLHSVPDTDRPIPHRSFVFWIKLHRGTCIPHRMSVPEIQIDLGKSDHLLVFVFWIKLQHLSLKWIEVVESDNRFCILLFSDLEIQPNISDLEIQLGLLNLLAVNFI